MSFNLLPLLFAAVAASSNPGPGVAPPPLVGARYFAGWYNCSTYPLPSCWSHFKGFTPTGSPVDNFFLSYPERLPTLGLYTTALDTIIAEVRAADRALDYFSMLYYDADAACAAADPNLAYCLDSSLAFMLDNSTAVWAGVQRLRFFITYSNDVDRGAGGMFVGAAGQAAWLSRVGTWLRAMAHPRYLRVNGRPVFEVLIPDIFTAQCGGNASLATQLLAQFRALGLQQGLGEPLIGGSWQNPSTPSTPVQPGPHPNGYLVYPGTDIPCAASAASGAACDLASLTSATLQQCWAACNATAGCAALVHWPASSNCTLKSTGGPGAPRAGADAYVRVLQAVPYDFTSTYNAAPPVCPGQPDWVCPQYANSWWPNATPSGARLFPYAQCADFQAAARGNHSGDPVPYLPNVIAGFDPRPWEEHSPSFLPPSEQEWEAALVQARELVAAPGNSRFGFPDASAPGGVQPAVCIYAWNELGEGGIVAPTAGAGSMMLDVLARVFPSPAPAHTGSAQ